MNKSLKLDRLMELVRQYEQDCKNGEDEKKGWPSTSYGLSKLFVNGITRCYGGYAKEAGKGVLVNCCSPGYVKTDMTSQKGGTTTEVGARTSIWLATLPDGSPIQGSYLAEI